MTHFEFGYSSSRTPNPLKLFIRCPGHIEEVPGIALVYEAGKISEESLLPYSRIMDDSVTVRPSCNLTHVAKSRRWKIFF